MSKPKMREQRYEEMEHRLEELKQMQIKPNWSNVIESRIEECERKLDNIANEGHRNYAAWEEEKEILESLMIQMDTVGIEFTNGFMQEISPKVKPTLSELRSIRMSFNSFYTKYQNLVSDIELLDEELLTLIMNTEDKVLLEEYKEMATICADKLEQIKTEVSEFDELIDTLDALERIRA